MNLQMHNIRIREMKMPDYVYIHGFNSGSQSRSGKELQRIIGAPVYCPQNDYSRPFAECLENLGRQIAANTNPADGQICVMGTSLGGFYALQLRLPEIGRVIAWNPVIYPAVQLKQFIGKNVRFTDNVEWNFSREACLSYAAAADAREWGNFYLAAHPLLACAKPTRYVVLGIHDELLDAELARTHWQNHASLLEIDSGHHVENFGHVLALLE